MKDEILVEATFHGKVSKIGNSMHVLVPAEIIGDMMLEQGSRIVVTLTRPKTMKVKNKI
ncbi:MAG: DUF2080 family transposase-associated protein [Methanomassiliicoccaceae archaeon]|nr:DUF2080 family transposase-associated protein [Methanomassiliicoccaceae archaeon]